MDKIISGHVCIYSIDDSYANIDREKVYLLSKIKACCDCIIVVSNTDYAQEEKNKLMDYADYLFVNIDGFDVNRYAFVIRNLLERSYSQVKRITIFNDSFFGPIFELNLAFEKMEQLDFWGMTAHPKFYIRKKGKKEKLQRRFLQSYFLSFSENIVGAESFKSYWDSVKKYKSVEEYNCCFEFFITEYFGENYQWDAYIDTISWEADMAQPYSTILFRQADLLKEKRIPIISKYTFIMSKAEQLSYSLGEQSLDALSFIKNHTSYDVSLIYDYLIRRFNLYNLMNVLGLSYVLNSEVAVKNSVRPKIAIFVHLYYEDLFGFIASYLIPLIDIADIYITTDTEQKRETLKDIFGSDVQIVLFNKDGREWAAYINVFFEKADKYDYCCFVHDKKSNQMYFDTVGRSFCKELWDNSLKSKDYVLNIIDLFEKNKWLGVLVPPAVYHGTYFYTGFDFWTNCYEKTRSFLEANGIFVPLDAGIPPISIGSVYWLRSTALKALFEIKPESIVFPTEPMPVDGTISHVLERAVPYFAQHKGFYTGTVMNNEFASLNMANIQVMLDGFKNIIQNNTKLEYTTFEIMVSKKSRRKKERKKDNIENE